MTAQSSSQSQSQSQSQSRHNRNGRVLYPSPPRRGPFRPYPYPYPRRTRPAYISWRRTLITRASGSVGVVMDAASTHDRYHILRPVMIGIVATAPFSNISMWHNYRRSITNEPMDRIAMSQSSSYSSRMRSCGESSESVIARGSPSTMRYHRFAQKGDRTLVRFRLEVCPAAASSLEAADKSRPSSSMLEPTTCPRSTSHNRSLTIY